jgi:hypothetical protein
MAKLKLESCFVVLSTDANEYKANLDGTVKLFATAKSATSTLVENEVVVPYSELPEELKCIIISEQEEDIKLDKPKLLKEFKDLTGIKIPVDGMLTAMTGTTTIDIIALDIIFSRQDNEYDYTNVTYKGEPCYMLQYAERKWGAKAVEIINLLTK